MSEIKTESEEKESVENIIEDGDKDEISNEEEEEKETEKNHTKEIEKRKASETIKGVSRTERNEEEVEEEKREEEKQEEEEEDKGEEEEARVDDREERDTFTVFGRPIKIHICGDQPARLEAFKELAKLHLELKSGERKVSNFEMSLKKDKTEETKEKFIAQIPASFKSAVEVTEVIGATIQEKPTKEKEDEDKPGVKETEQKNCIQTIVEEPIKENESEEKSKEKEQSQGNGVETSIGVDVHKEIEDEEKSEEKEQEQEKGKQEEGIEKDSKKELLKEDLEDLKSQKKQLTKESKENKERKGVLGEKEVRPEAEEKKTYGGRYDYLINSFFETLPQKEKTDKVLNSNNQDQLVDIILQNANVDDNILENIICPLLNFRESGVKVLDLSENPLISKNGLYSLLHTLEQGNTLLEKLCLNEITNLHEESTTITSNTKHGGNIKSCDDDHDDIAGDNHGRREEDNGGHATANFLLHQNKDNQREMLIGKLSSTFLSGSSNYSQISSIFLQGCKLSDTEGAIFFDAIKENSHLTTISLSNNYLAEESLGMISILLANPSCKVKFLNLACNEIKSTKIFKEAFIEKGLFVNRSVQELSLSGNKIGCSGCETLSKTLLFIDTRSETVSFDYNDPPIPKLTALHLDGCNIGDDGAIALGKALTTNYILIDLTLSCNNIGNRGAAALLGGLEGNYSLDSLNLSRNIIGPEGCGSVELFLRNNKRLTSLNLSWNDFHNTASHNIRDGLHNNASLLYLNISKCYLSDLDLNGILKAIEKNATLKSIDLRENEANKELIEIVQSLAMKYRPKIFTEQQLIESLDNFTVEVREKTQTNMRNETIRSTTISQYKAAMNLVDIAELERKQEEIRANELRSLAPHEAIKYSISYGRRSNHVTQVAVNSLSTLADVREELKEILMESEHDYCFVGKSGEKILLSEEPNRKVFSDCSENILLRPANWIDIANE